jgi:hypothetical protein
VIKDRDRAATSTTTVPSYSPELPLMRLKNPVYQYKEAIVLYLHSVDFPLCHSCLTRLQRRL